MLEIVVLLVGLALLAMLGSKLLSKSKGTLVNEEMNMGFEQLARSEAEQDEDEARDWALEEAQFREDMASDDARAWEEYEDQYAGYDWTEHVGDADQNDRDDPDEDWMPPWDDSWCDEPEPRDGDQ